jgi:Fe-S cluster assembly ATP-binding protein
MLKITNIHATVETTEILKGFSLEVPAGSIDALMGQNGSGKSTLAHIIAGHPGYEVTEGSITFNGLDVLDMEPEERAAAGIFLAFQYPAAIPGVPISQFLRLARNSQEKARGEKPTALAPFLNELKVAMKSLNLPWDFASRSVNDGFSGGEKKRLEMLQMLMLKPKLVILDEIDSGLDIDAMKIVAEAVNNLKDQQPETSVVMITHYQRLLNYIKPDSVHIVHDGTIAQSGGPDLAHHLEASGYAELIKAR